jgi:cobalt/nickel transport system permease protein
MHEEEFAHGSSLLHALDPRLKIVLAAAFSIMVAISTDYHAMIMALACSISLVILGKLNILLVLRRLAFVNAFVVLIWLFLPWTTPGEPLLTLGKMNISLEGADIALQITFKANAIVLGIMALLSTSSLVTLGHALSQIRIPNKLVQLFFFTVRYSYTIHEEYIRLRNALKVRCFRPRTNVHTYRTYAFVLTRLLLGSIDRSERILSAMKCRGFKGKKGFPVLDRFHMHRKDVVFLLVFVSFLIILGLLQWTTILI